MTKAKRLAPSPQANNKCPNYWDDAYDDSQASEVQQEQTCGEWVERWHGSHTEEWWSILFKALYQGTRLPT